MQLTMRYLKHFHRYYQPKRLAGGVSLVGGGDYSAGIFGMEFSQPPYRFPEGSFQLDINFSFKKSVFFADYVMICLGTGITSSESSPYITQVRSNISECYAFFLCTSLCFILSVGFRERLRRRYINSSIFLFMDSKITS